MTNQAQPSFEILALHEVLPNKNTHWNRIENMYYDYMFESVKKFRLNVRSENARASVTWTGIGVPKLSTVWNNVL